MKKYVDLFSTNYDGTQTAILRFSIDTSDEDQKISVTKLNDHKGDYKDLLKDGEFIIGKNAMLFSIKDIFEKS